MRNALCFTAAMNDSTALLDVVVELEEYERKALRGAHELDWLTLRREILGYGGICCNADVKPEDIPGDLYRVNGKPADLVAAEACSGAPWGETGDDVAMLAYLWRSWRSYDASRPSVAVGHRAPRRKVTEAPRAAPGRPRGLRSFAELVVELRTKHGASVDLSALRSEWVTAYESGERVTITLEGREYRGTIGATRGVRPAFVLLTSLPL